MEHKKESPAIFSRPGYAADYIKTDARESTYLSDPHISNLKNIAYALATELWAERERSRVVESLMSKGVQVTPEAIEKYIPSDQETAQWQDDQDAMIQRVFGVLARNSYDRPFSEPRFKDRS